MQSQQAWLRRIVRVLAALLAFPAVRSLLRCLCRTPGRMTRPEERPPQRTGCQDIPPALNRVPDPLIYDQYFLAAQGLAVTWDNPDIHLEHNGSPVSSHDLKPATVYDVVARIWNGSTNAPAAQLPVHFSYLSFGIGTAKSDIGTTPIDLGVKGSVHCPAFARHAWKTPETPGHYCVQVEIGLLDNDPKNDANPANNLGQHNTDVRPLNSPRATFRFPVRNPLRRPLTLALRADDYTIAPLRPCRDDTAAVPEQTADEQAMRARRTLAVHGQGKFGPPHWWEIAIEPAELVLRPDEEREVVVVTTAPDSFVGRQAINVQAHAGEIVIGGVTLYAEGTA